MTYASGDHQAKAEIHEHWDKVKSVYPDSQKHFDETMESMMSDEISLKRKSNDKNRNDVGVVVVERSFSFMLLFFTYDD